MSFGLFLKSVEKDKYNDILEDPKKLSKYVEFHQSQHVVNFDESEKNSLGDVVLKKSKMVSCVTEKVFESIQMKKRGYSFSACLDK